MGKNYYEILEVSPSANLNEIKRQYLILIRLLHPDRIHEDDVKSYGEEKLKRINEAYEILSSPQKRVEYDRKLRARKTSSRSHQPGFSSRSSEYSQNASPGHSNSSSYTSDEFAAGSSYDAPSGVATPPNILNSSTFKTLMMITIVTYLFGGLIFVNASGVPSSDQFLPVAGIVVGGIVGAWLYYSNFGGNNEKELDVVLGLLSGLGVILIVAVAIWLIVVIVILGLFFRVIADEFK
jgi:hypothetical protein